MERLVGPGGAVPAIVFSREGGTSMACKSVDGWAVKQTHQEI
ncbi:MAG TPA: hypothetical protein PKM73_10945 [Verrucomicrobiota bacterium]|nr:hypothetical protein [Verrucomicrobiota bacterium]HNU52725.1 hypothetical protein [Verrucomicrobiota bacterium]